MEEFINTITNLKISEELKFKMLQDIFVLLVEKIGSTFSDRFTSEDVKNINNLAENRNYQALVEELRKKFTDEEWEKIVSDQVSPIIESYQKEVLETV